MRYRFVSHMYWFRKERFLLERDRYAVWTVFAVESGSFRYEIDGEKGAAGAGDLVICPPQRSFAREVLEPLTFHFFHYQVHRDEERTDEPLEYPVLCRIQDKGRLFSTYRYIRSVMDREEPERAHKLEHLLCDLMLLAEEGEELGRAEQEAGEHGEDQTMLHARRWLDAHATQGTGIRELAGQLGVTPVQLTRRFRAAHGVNPQDYVTELRIREAGRLLAGTRLPLHEIAGRCGYENGYYLSRVFRNKTGLNPSQYRKQYQV
ncbi:helix-turn-helix domain-containing protein [Paenibacillus sp. 1P07SE]|uniref:helix-turn-helix domain-containing protein n=1 Tax=Paenibacillus sp. 1P07SE TaxID=3132209 RepID=UPI0039A641FB